VKMTGENPDEELEGKPYEFGSRTVLERAQVVVCGPVMNILLAVLCIGFSFYLGRLVSAHLHKPPVIGWVQEDSPASKAGMEIGDKILAINGEKIETWQEAEIQITTQAKTTMHFLVEKKNGAQVEIKAIPDEIGSMGIGSLGISHAMPAKIGGLTPGYPAEKAELQIGDEILKIEGQVVENWHDMSIIIHKNPNIPLLFEIKREDEVFSISITPTLDETGEIGLIGISPYEEQILEQYGVLKSLKSGFSETWHLTVVTFQFIGRLFTGKSSPKSLGGPIMIYKVAGAAAKAGLSPLIYLMGFISLQLGILNLLPIPVLDGGHLFFFSIELIKGSPVSMRHREIAQQIGMGILVLLMVYVFYVDIMRFFVH